MEMSPVREVGQGAPAGAFPFGQRKSQVFPFTGGIVAPEKTFLGMDVFVFHTSYIYTAQALSMTFVDCVYLGCTTLQNRVRQAGHFL